MLKPELMNPQVEAQEYLCQTCDARFFYMPPGELVCPNCGGRGQEILVAMDEVEEESEDRR